jgi:hypothetical protein
MTPIPDEHHSARELQETFARLGRERSSKRVVRRHVPARRALAIAVASLLACAAVAGAVRLVVGDGTIVRGEQSPGKELRRAPRDRTLAAARAHDPVGGFDWGMRAYASAAGGRCLLVGRLDAGRIGRVTDGRFEPFSTDSPGTCSSAGSHSLVATRIYPAADGGRTVLFGFFDRTIHSARIESPRGDHAVDIAPDGTFLTVSRGRRPARETLVLTGVRTERRVLEPGR